MPAPYRRRTGLIYRRGSIGPDPRPGEGILDGGHDAPLSRRARLAYRVAFLALIVGGVALVVWATLSS